MLGLKVTASELLLTEEPPGSVRTNQFVITVAAKLESLYAVLQSLYWSVCRTVPFNETVETDAEKELPRQKMELVSTTGVKEILAGLTQEKN